MIPGKTYWRCFSRTSRVSSEVGAWVFVVLMVSSTGGVEPRPYRTAYRGRRRSRGPRASLEKGSGARLSGEPPVLDDHLAARQDRLRRAGDLPPLVRVVVH